MAGADSFVDHLLELLAPLGEVQARRMFGGCGIFREGIMFALVAEDTLYLKTDHESNDAFEQRDLPAFTYRRHDGKKITISYRRCPDAALVRSSTLRPWAERAWEAALRQARARREKSSRP